MVLFARSWKPKKKSKEDLSPIDGEVVLKGDPTVGKRGRRR